MQNVLGARERASYSSTTFGHVHSPEIVPVDIAWCMCCFEVSGGVGQESCGHADVMLFPNQPKVLEVDAPPDNDAKIATGFYGR